MVSLRHDGFDPGSTDQTGYALRSTVSLVVERSSSFLWDSIQRRTWEAMYDSFFQAGETLPDGLSSQPICDPTLRLAELQLRPFLDLVPVNGSSCDLKDVQRVISVWAILRTGIITLRANRHIAFDMRHTFFFVNPDEIQCHLGVLHPEVPGLGLTEEK